MENRLKYIGSNISIKKIRNYILDNELTEDHQILMNTYDFDNLILGHRDSYGVSITVPYYLIGVPIVENTDIPKGRIRVINNEDE